MSRLAEDLGPNELLCDRFDRYGFPGASSPEETSCARFARYGSSGDQPPAPGAVDRARAQPPPPSVRPVFTNRFYDQTPTGGPRALYLVGSASAAAVPGEPAEEEPLPLAAPPALPADGPDADEDGEEEAAVPRMARDPGEPTKAEKEAHEATHLPFRSWCPFCVAGRSDNPPHRRAPTDKDQPVIPEVHLDYAYVRREEEDHPTTVLVAKHRQPRAVRA